MVESGYRGLKSITNSYRWEYKELKGLQRVARGFGGYDGLQGLTGAYKGLQGFTGGNKGFQKLTEG